MKKLIAKNAVTGLFYNKEAAAFVSSSEKATRLDEVEFSFVSATFDNVERHLAPNHVPAPVTISAAEHAALVAVAEAASVIRYDVKIAGWLADNDKMALQQLVRSIANLAAVREGGAK